MSEHSNAKWLFFCVCAVCLTFLANGCIVRAGSTNWDWRLLGGELGTWLSSSGVSAGIALYLVRLLKQGEAREQKLTDKRGEVERLRALVRELEGEE